MKPNLLILLATTMLLAACANGPTTPDGRQPSAMYRDTMQPKRQMADLHRDEAQCQYELSMATYSRPYQPPYALATNDPNIAAGVANLGRGISAGGPGAATYALCMRAKGWELVGYE